MKLMVMLSMLSIAFGASAKTLTCEALLSSEKEVVELVKADTRKVELDKEGNAELAGIVVDAYETHGISYNYAVFVKDGHFTYIGAENEVLQSGSGTKLKNATEASFSSSSISDGSLLEVECKIQ